MKITEDYRQLQSKLHENPNYGVASVEFAPLVAQVLRGFGVRELLDYGAGKGRLGQSLPQYLNPLPILHHYDPAIPAWANEPNPAECVACIDVLEHIEPDCLDAVLDDLQRLTRRIGFFTVHCGPAIKHLADGRNAHLIQQDSAWWLPKLMQRFELNQFSRTRAGFWVVVEAKTPN
ncbi:MAG: hypothetical protein ABUS57_08285 [Pseudomonadota bacterium]